MRGSVVGFRVRSSASDNTYVVATVRRSRCSTGFESCYPLRDQGWAEHWEKGENYRNFE